MQKLSSPASIRAAVALAAARQVALRQQQQRPVVQDQTVTVCSDFPQGFRAFLPFWRFINRETGAVVSFADLWPGQQAFAQLMINEPWLFALKAGKLGFTELECAWDGYVTTFGPPNSRVHLFSKEYEAAKSLLDYVRFGLRGLPASFGVSILAGERGGDTLKSLRVRVSRPDSPVLDVRTVYAYATSLNMAIDQSCIHAHIDEWAHMEHPKEVWATVQTTVSPIGTCHIVSRGAGEDEFVQSLWQSAAEGSGRVKGFFADWRARPDRDDVWYKREASDQTASGIAHFAPESPDDAFIGDEENTYLEPEWWDACHVPTLPVLTPGDTTPLVVGADAGTSGDSFALVAVSRHPQNHKQPAVRAVRVWRPDMFPDKRINYSAVENWLRVLCQGGCLAGHAQAPAFRQEECEFCQRGELTPRFNVIELAYDPYQLEDMMQRLRRERVVNAHEFAQGNDRYESDRMLRNLVINRNIVHNGDATLREHIVNAKAKLQDGQESKMRIVKKAPHRKVDAAVATSMAVYECLRLNIPERVA